MDYVCMYLGSVACIMCRTSCFPLSLSGMGMALQVRTTQLAHADQRVAGKSPRYPDYDPWLSPCLHGRNRLACAWPVGIDFWHRPWPRPLRRTCPFSSAFV